MKSVLIVIYSLSVRSYSKDGRLLNLIGQLRSCGWEPVVLTNVSIADSPEELTAQLPEDIDIIRTGLFAAAVSRAGSRSGFLSSRLESDGQRLWEFLSRRKAARIIKNGGADLLCTVSPPFSIHRIGLRLKKKFPNLPWVADLGSQEPSEKGHEKNLLARVTDNADMIVPGESDIPAQELSELFEKACRAVAAKKLRNP